MTTIRQQRVQELLYQELSILVENEFEDPFLSLLTVTNVEISRDLRHAKIYVHHGDKSISRSKVLRRLQKATPYVRRQLAQRTALRSVPEVLFYYDDTPERAARVDELLERIRAARQEEAGGEGAETRGNAESHADAVVEADASGDEQGSGEPIP